jgi:hypothetical protein
MTLHNTIAPAIPFDTSKIDSLTILIPRESVQIIDSTFEQKYLLYFPDTDEVETKARQKNVHIELIDDIKLRIDSLSRMWNGENRKFIRFVITSKFLKSRYFEGINKGNIKLIYELLMQMQIAYFDYDTFLNSYIADIDICIDMKLNINQQKEVKKQYTLRVLLKLQRYIQQLKNVTNLQINERTKATEAKPFIKFYNKHQEFEVRSKTFKERYLNEYEKILSEGVYRAEVTIKNSKHRKRIGLSECNTLAKLLDLDQSFLSKLHRTVLSEYIEPKNIIRVKGEDLTPNDKATCNDFNYFISLGLSQYEIVGNHIKGLEGKQLQRARKRAVKLFKHIKDDQKAQANNMQRAEISKALQTLGIIE